LVIPASLICAFVLKTHYDASLAITDWAPYLGGAFIILLGAPVILVSAIVGFVKKVGPRPYNALAAVLGIASMLWFLTPSLGSRVTAHQHDLEALGNKLRRYERVSWPVHIGPFTFLSGGASRDGLTLWTRLDGDVKRGLYWQFGNGENYGTPLAGRWSQLDYED
jgi:hypothetical protein